MQYVYNKVILKFGRNKITDLSYTKLSITFSNLDSIFNILYLDSPIDPAPPTGIHALLF